MEFVAALIGSLLLLLVVAAPVVGWINLLRLRRLERRLAALEIEVRAPKRGPAAVPGPPPAVAPSPGPVPSVPPPPRAGAPAAPAAIPAAGRTGLGAHDLETIIGGRWLNRIGIVALLLAAGFFLKYAFDNDWIGPQGRVVIGLLGGSGLLGYGHWLQRRGYPYFSEGISGLGGGVLYLSLYAARQLYHLLPQGGAFAAMIAVTAGLVAIAVGRGSQRLAFLAFLGGFLTPALLSTGRDAQIELFTYLAILDAGLLWFARARDWRALEPLGWGASALYLVGWFDRFYTPERLGRTTFFSLLGYGEFALAQWLRLRRALRTRREDLALVLLNTAGIVVMLHVLLFHDQRWALTIAVLALAALHVVAARLLPAEEVAQGPAARLLFAGLALTFVTLAIPIRLEGKWVAMAWAIEGASLVAAGLRAREGLLRGAGLLLFVLPPAQLAIHPIDARQALYNPRLATFAVVVACFGAALALARRHRELLAAAEARAFLVTGIAANLIALWGASLEVWDFAAEVGVGLDPRLARQAGLSLLWTLAATVLLVAGVRGRSAALRWQGLALFGTVVWKVFLFDLSFLERGYRILSFLALGAVLVVVSFLYQRRLRESAQDKGGQG